MIVPPNKLAQISTLVRLCGIAYKAHPELWQDSEDGTTVFNFPDYGGLPQRIAENLSSDCVDVIGEYLTTELGNASMGNPFDPEALKRLLLEYLEAGYDLPY